MENQAENGKVVESGIDNETDRKVENNLSTQENDKEINTTPAEMQENAVDDSDNTAEKSEENVEEKSNEETDEKEENEAVNGKPEGLEGRVLNC